MTSELTPEQKDYYHNTIVPESKALIYSTERVNFDEAFDLCKRVWQIAKDKGEDYPEPLTYRSFESPDAMQEYAPNVSFRYGNFEAQWVTKFRLLELKGEDITEYLPYMELCEKCHFYTFRDEEQEVLFVDRPVGIYENDEGEVHRTDGPAIEYSDGNGVYALENFWFPKHVVMDPAAMKIEEVNDEQNEEVRRILMEQFGISRYVKESNAEIIDEGENPVENTYELLVMTKFGQRLMTHCPSTGRKYFLALPDEAKNCAEAQKILWGGKDINIIGRT